MGADSKIISIWLYRNSVARSNLYRRVKNGMFAKGSPQRVVTSKRFLNFQKTLLPPLWLVYSWVSSGLGYPLRHSSEYRRRWIKWEGKNINAKYYYYIATWIFSEYTFSRESIFIFLGADRLKQIKRSLYVPFHADEKSHVIIIVWCRLLWSMTNIDNSGCEVLIVEIRTKMNIQQILCHIVQLGS